MVWISVDERLPDNNRVVLIGNDKKKWSDVGFLRYRGNPDEHWAFSDGEPVNPDGGVTHWMEMPQPPVA